MFVFLIFNYIQIIYFQCSKWITRFELAPSVWRTDMLTVKHYIHIHKVLCHTLSEPNGLSLRNRTLFHLIGLPKPFNSLAGTRTLNPTVNSRMLYH